ncbi:MAG: CRISPR system precrRNA processing endoribonuclease RAMP protein Cas6, partial [Acidobacteria bacterium]|nr:CRISPR system precrRNA processing endoribonuclease RAMP protein Cas6 [Acidobacteriota bacterium]
QVRTVRQDLAWVDWTSYSRRQATLMQLGGHVGEIEFEGPLMPLWGWLRLGEVVHVGKNTAFGLGQYRIRR